MASVKMRFVASNRVWPGWAFIPALLAGMTSPSVGQMLPERPIIRAPPWNALYVFDQIPVPLLSDPATRDIVAPEDTPVRTRQWPEYRPRGVRAGAWMFYPTLTAGGFYESNVFSSNTNREGDLLARLGANLRAVSLWQRHGLALQASAITTAYREHSSLNETDAVFQGHGHLDIDYATTLLTAFRAAYLHEKIGSVTSPANAAEPTPYTMLSQDLTLRHEFGRFTGSVGARVDSYDYGLTVAQNGSPISQDARDGQIYTGHGRVDYSISEVSAVFVALEGNTRLLRGTAQQSYSSAGYRALAGVDLEFTHLIKGELAAGYMNQRYDSPSIGPVEGPAYRASLTWSPSRQLDIYLNTEQQVVTTSTSLTAILANAVQLGFDYEFRPNVVLSGAAAYEKDKFKGQPRVDNVYLYDARIRYLLNEICSVDLHYRFTRRDSNEPKFSFDNHLFGVTARAQF